jgi:hypothetical protein
LNSTIYATENCNTKGQVNKEQSPKTDLQS